MVQRDCEVCPARGASLSKGQGWPSARYCSEVCDKDHAGADLPFASSIQIRRLFPRERCFCSCAAASHRRSIHPLIIACKEAQELFIALHPKRFQSNTCADTAEYALREEHANGKCDPLQGRGCGSSNACPKRGSAPEALPLPESYQCWNKKSARSSLRCLNTGCGILQAMARETKGTEPSETIEAGGKITIEPVRDDLCCTLASVDGRAPGAEYICSASFLAKTCRGSRFRPMSRCFLRSRPGDLLPSRNSLSSFVTSRVSTREISFCSFIELSESFLARRGRRQCIQPDAAPAFIFSF